MIILYKFILVKYVQIVYIQMWGLLLNNNSKYFAHIENKFYPIKAICNLEKIKWNSKIIDVLFYTEWTFKIFRNHVFVNSK